MSRRNTLDPNVSFLECRADQPLREWIAPQQDKSIRMSEPHTIRRRPLIIGVLVCAAVLSAAPRGASAATLEADYGTLELSARPGEVNAVSVKVPDAPPESDRTGARVIVTDAGAPLTLSDRACSLIDAHTAACTGDPDEELYHDLTSLSLRLGDMDDAVLLTRGPGEPALWGLSVRGNQGDDRLVSGVFDSWMYGGPGNDVLDSSSQPPPDNPSYFTSRLWGEQGDDRLIGSSGDDVLGPDSGADYVEGGAGDDVFWAHVDRSHGAFGADVYLGGDGEDSIDYASRSRPVHVDLADDQPDGASGENDRLTAIENVRGGRGDDVLAGDDGPNRLSGSDGRDQLIGRAGNDQLDTGSDLSESGCCRRYVPPRAVDEYGEELASCGPGEDRMSSGVTARDFLTPDCEQIGNDFYSDGLISIAPTSRETRLRYRVRCPPHRDGSTYPTPVSPTEEPDPEPPGRCSGEIRATRPGNPARILGHGSFPAGKWTNRDLTARLTRLGRRLMRRERGVKAVVTLRFDFTAQDADPPSQTVAWTTRLRR